MKKVGYYLIEALLTLLAPIGVIFLLLAIPSCLVLAVLFRPYFSQQEEPIILKRVFNVCLTVASFFIYIGTCFFQGFTSPLRCWIQSSLGLDGEPADNLATN